MLSDYIVLNEIDIRSGFGAGISIPDRENPNLDGDMVLNEVQLAQTPRLVKKNDY